MALTKAWFTQNVGTVSVLFLVLFWYCFVVSEWKALSLGLLCVRINAWLYVDQCSLLWHTRNHQYLSIREKLSPLLFGILRAGVSLRARWSNPILLIDVVCPQVVDTIYIGLHTACPEPTETRKTLINHNTVYKSFFAEFGLPSGRPLVLLFRVFSVSARLETPVFV